jgi:hypothetical protein
MSNQHAYIVSYVYGSSGSMMISLIEKIMYPEKSKPFVITAHNNAHNNLFSPNVTFNWEKVGRSGARAATAAEYFENIRSVNPERDVFWQTHWYMPDAMIERFPNAKIVVISHTLEDLEEIAINNFYKFVIAEFDGNSSSVARGTWHYLRNTCPHLFNSEPHTKPKDIPTEEQKISIELLKGSCISAGYHLVNVPDKYQDKICKIMYNDIINNPDLILATLSEFLNTPIPDFARDQYYGYCNRQKEFITKVKGTLDL